MTNSKSAEDIIPETGKELTPQQIERLKLDEKYRDYGKAPREEFKKELPLLQVYEGSDIENHEYYCTCFMCLLRFFKIIHLGSKPRKESFFYGWLHFMILTKECGADKKIEENPENLYQWLCFLDEEFKRKGNIRPIRYNWHIVDELMHAITSKQKYDRDHLTSTQKNQKYKTGPKYVKRVVEAYRKKIESDKYYLAYARIMAVKKAMDRNWALSMRIVSYLEDMKKRFGLILFKHRDIQRGVFHSKEKIQPLGPCFQFLENIGEIIWLEEKKLIFYIGYGRNKGKKISSIDFFIKSIS